jgi:hypothetical protein
MNLTDLQVQDREFCVESAVGLHFRRKNADHDRRR